jgi:hypothetical protein
MLILTALLCKAIHFLNSSAIPFFWPLANCACKQLDADQHLVENVNYLDIPTSERYLMTSGVIEWSRLPISQLDFCQ